MTGRYGTRPGAPRSAPPTAHRARGVIAAVLLGCGVLAIVVAILNVIAGGLAGASASPTPTAMSTPATTVEPTAGPTPTATLIATPTLSLTPVPTPTSTPLPTRTTPSMPPTPEPTPVPTRTTFPTSTPVASPTPTPPRTPTPIRTPAPTGSTTAGPTATPERTARPTPRAGDPSDLPRFPGSRLEERRRSTQGDLVRLELRYRTSASLDAVRRHYRSMLRQHEWFVGEVDVDDDSWEVDANRGSREVSIELERDDGRTEIDVEVTWPMDGDDGG